MVLLVELTHLLVRDYINGLDNPDELLDRISSSTERPDATATAFYSEVSNNST